MNKIFIAATAFTVVALLAINIVIVARIYAQANELIHVLEKCK
jgi:hypothetical protein